MSSSRDEMFQQFLPQLIPALKASFEAGFENGFQAGRMIGFVEGVDAMKPAVSDGLRYGAPECGRAMQFMKNFGLDTGENKEANDDDDGAVFA